MSLTKCSECQKEVSDKAATCPNCGNPINAPVIQVVTNPNTPVQLEFTSKKWKLVILLSWGAIVAGLILLSIGVPNQDENLKALGLFAGFLGLVGLLVGKIGAWWSNR